MRRYQRAVPTYLEVITAQDEDGASKSQRAGPLAGSASCNLLTAATLLTTQTMGIHDER